MNKEEILNFIKEHADNFSIQMKRHYKELYNSINVTYNSMGFIKDTGKDVHIFA